MQSLELKIPPPALALIVAIAMWGTARVAPTLNVPVFLRLFVTVATALMGLGFALAGITAFRRARTTINPTKPASATSLVSSGIYQVTRNPMYVGLWFVRVSWGVYLSCAWSLIGPLALFLYINKFQIMPEERALAAVFGSEYDSYKKRVRRWL